ncbi:MAG: hypothetical protein QOH72_3425 [Solirubrobacteraceae bacterium]|jgi:hypothetical protein|nr:hypothetical protein [Solirubrobacteraceae bacterium]
MKVHPGSIGAMSHRGQPAKPGLAALNGGQLTAVWLSSTVLLTALGVAFLFAGGRTISPAAAPTDRVRSA